MKEEEEGVEGGAASREEERIGRSSKRSRSSSVSPSASTSPSWSSSLGSGQMERRLEAGEAGGEVPAVEGEDMVSKGEKQLEESVDEERPAKGQTCQRSRSVQRYSSHESNYSPSHSSSLSTSS